MKTLPIDADELFTKVSAYDVVDEDTGEVILECNEEVTPGEGRRAPQARHQGVQGPLHRQPQRGSVPARDVDDGQDRDARAGDHGDLPAPAPG